MKTFNFKLLGTAFAMSAALLASQGASATSTANTVQLYENGSVATQGGFPSTSTSAGFAGNCTGSPPCTQNYGQVVWDKAANGVWNDWPNSVPGAADSSNPDDVAKWINAVVARDLPGVQGVSSTAASFADLSGSASNQTLNFGTTINFLEVKYDNKLALWWFSNGISSINFTSDFPQAWSHYRAYAAVPIPAAVWLIGSALVGLVGFGRKKVSMSDGFAA
jgi:hypothetical protein